MLKNIIRFSFKVSIEDANIPFRLMRQDKLKNIIPMIPANCFCPNVFISILANKSGNDYLEIPVTHQARQTGTASISIQNIFKIITLCTYQLFQFRVGMSSKAKVLNDIQVDYSRKKVA